MQFKTKSPDKYNKLKIMIDTRMFCRMLRQLSRGLPAAAAARNTAPVNVTGVRCQSGGGPPPKIECFVDGKKVLVDPGTADTFY